VCVKEREREKLIGRSRDLELLLHPSADLEYVFNIAAYREANALVTEDQFQQREGSQVKIPSSRTAVMSLWDKPPIRGQ